jgi:hypothetical protein
VSEGRHRVAEEHQAKSRCQQIESGQLSRRGVGLLPINIGYAGGLRACLPLSQHRPGDVQRCYAASGTDGARKLQRRRATAAADVQHPLAAARRGEGEQRLRHRRQGDVGVLLSRHPGVAARPVPEGKLVGVDLLGVGHAGPPVRLTPTLHC